MLSGSGDGNPVVLFIEPTSHSSSHTLIPHTLTSTLSHPLMGQMLLGEGTPPDVSCIGSISATRDTIGISAPSGKLAIVPVAVSWIWLARSFWIRSALASILSAASSACAALCAAAVALASDSVAAVCAAVLAFSAPVLALSALNLALLASFMYCSE